MFHKNQPSRVICLVPGKGQAPAEAKNPLAIRAGKLVPCKGTSLMPMTLEHAIALVNQTAERMTAMYGQPVFDELAIVEISERGGRTLSYSGPRRPDFHKNFAADLDALKCSLLQAEHHVGDFHFARDASGTLFDTFIALGEDLYLICNNVSRTIDEIARDGRWLNAQVPFAEMAEKFRHNPLTI
jgi:hypothetical protein